MLVIAHRGANREAFENTYEAFDKAVDCGAHRIELDVHFTKDREIVIYHDENLHHLLNLDLRLGELTKDDLNKVKLPNHECMPFLKDVIKKYIKDIELNVEIKGHNKELAEAVGQMIMSSGYVDRFIVSCFSVDPLIHIKNRFPQIRTACLWGIDTFSWPFFAVCAPNVMMDICSAKIIHPEVTQVDENFVDQALARGWSIYPWVRMVGEEEDREGMWAYLKSLGIHGLCTNYPRELREWLARAAVIEDQYSKQGLT